MYEAVLRAIKRTNEGATNQSNAAVKRIDSLDIGAPAAEAWTQPCGARRLGAVAGRNAGRVPGGPGAMARRECPARGMPPGGCPARRIRPAGARRNASRPACRMPGGMGMPGTGMPGWDARHGHAGWEAWECRGHGIGSTAGVTDEQIRQQLIQSRYVDDKGMPLTYDASAPPL